MLAMLLLACVTTPTPDVSTVEVDSITCIDDTVDHTRWQPVVVPWDALATVEGGGTHAAYEREGDVLSLYCPEPGAVYVVRWYLP